MESWKFLEIRRFYILGLVHLLFLAFTPSYILQMERFAPFEAQFPELGFHTRSLLIAP